MVYKKEYLEAFLKNQSQLFDEPVAETLEEADAFLDDCMAVVADSFKDVIPILWQPQRIAYHACLLKTVK